MVPRISKRGHSFKGAGQYYLHDKQASTKERVGFTYVHNLPTDNADTALSWMAHTAMNAERLKARSGIKSSGRKSTAGEVYCYSLAWHPHQKPDKEMMIESAFSTLELLDLYDHEAVFVSHTDTEHPHVHVIANLVHPDTGKTQVMSYDRLTLSAWAEDLENNEGQIRCEQRVINNAKRNNRIPQNDNSNVVKHKEQRLEMAERIQSLYTNSVSGTAFQQALEEQGYTLARGDRRGFVLVDAQGKITSLSRQLKGQRAKDIKERLFDVGELQHAKTLSEQRKVSAQNKLENTQNTDKSTSKDGGNEPSKNEIVSPAVNPPTQENVPLTNKPQHILPTHYNYSSEQFLMHLDALREWEQKTERSKDELISQQENYKRVDVVEQMKQLQDKLDSSRNEFVTKLSKKERKRLEHLDNLKRTLASIDQRISEQHQALDKKALEDKPSENEPAEKDAKQKRLDYIRRSLEDRKRPNNPDKGDDLGR